MADPVSFTIATVAQIGISYLFPNEGPRLKDLKVSASTYGAQIPQVFGLSRVAGNLVWCTPIKEKKKKKMQGPGKGMSFSNEYTYSASVAFAFCQGPVTQFRRLWADNKLIYDATGKSEVVSTGKYNFRIFNGDENQLPCAVIERDKGVGNAPAYRGLCYLVIEDMPLADFQNRIPQMTAEVFVATGYVATDGPPLDGSYSYQRNQLIVDSPRGFMYLMDQTSPGAPFIRRFRLKDGVPDKIIYAGGPDTGACLPFSYDNGKLDYIMGVNAAGDLIVQTGGINNYVSYSMLDAVSYSGKATTGTSDAFGRACGAYGQGFPPDAGTSSTHAISIASSGKSRMVVVGFGGTLSYIGTTNPTEFTGTTLDSDPEYADAVVCGRMFEEDIGFYFLTGGGDSGDYLRVAGGGAVVFPPPLGKIYGRDIIYDTTDRGCLFTYVVYDQDGTSKNMMGKYSPGAFPSPLWTKEVPSDAVGVFYHGGYAANSQYAFTIGPANGYASSSWLIDTMTGEWITMKTDYTPGALAAVDVTEGEVYEDQDAYIGYPVGDGTEIVGTDPQYYDSLRGMIITLGAGGRLLRVGGQAPVATLGGMVESLLRMGGLTSESFDLSRLESVDLMGYGYARGTDIKSILDELRRVYMFDMVESQGKLVGVLRSAGSNDDDAGAPVETLVQDVLGSSSDDASDFWQETRLQEADLPERISLTYMNYDDDFMTSTAHSKRISNPVPTMFSRQQVAMEINIVMTPTEAKTRVTQALYAQWLERTKHSSRLPWAYLNLDPADLVAVNMNDGRGYNERLHMNNIGADFAIEIESFGQDSGAYQSTVSADGGGAGGGDPLAMPAVAAPIVINTPLLRDQDDTAAAYSLYYTAIANSSPTPFTNAQLYRATALPDFQTLGVYEQDVDWATLTSTLQPPRHGHFALDWENKLTLYGSSDDFELEPITDDELWAGHNAVLVGDEILQFRDCEQNADGSWTIWNLLRGRRGTEYATHTHQPGETLVVLQTANAVSKQGDTLDSRGQQRYFKAVANGRSIAESVERKIVYEPRDQMPYAPKDIRREFTGDANAVTVTWKRRTRMGGNMMDYTGTVPLQETSERYEIYFAVDPYSGDLSRGNSLPRVYWHMATTTEPTYTWTGENTSFDRNLDFLNVVIYQLSSSVGRGFPGARSIEPWQDF